MDWRSLKELDRFLASLSSELGRAMQKNVIPTNWLNTQKGSRKGQLHSRILGLLAKVSADLGYIVEVESGFNPKSSRQFRPDIQLWESDSHKFLVEYESTNSSDLRVLKKDLAHYVQSLDNDQFPEYWLVLYTLPDSASGNWRSWDHRASNPQLTSIRKNPHQYYKSVFRQPFGRYPKKDLPSAARYIENSPDWGKRKIIFVNLTINGLEVDFPSRLGRKYPLGVKI